MKLRRRIIIEVLCLLAAGAAVNVAVAWCDAIVQTERVRRILSTPTQPMMSDPIVLLHALASQNEDQIKLERGRRNGLPLRSMAAYLSDRPLSCRYGWTIGDGDFWAGREYTLPLAPVLPGFAVNTLFYAGVLWALFAGPFALRRIIRRRRGHCPACAYPVGSSEVCTECGGAVRATPS